MYPLFVLLLTAPGRPCIIPEECSCQNNSVTIAWTPYQGGVVEAYTLELDDGNGGDFRVSRHSDLSLTLGKWLISGYSG